MSKCAICHGSGSTACAECDGVGYTLQEPEAANSDELIRKLCDACHGRPLHTCRSCQGTGVVDKVPAVVAALEPAPAAASRPAVPTDRLAGRWKGVQGSWYEFVPDGKGYRATAGGPAGVSVTGTATLVGHTVKLDASDKLLGHYELELTLHGTHLEGIDRNAGYPIPVALVRA
jgi:hypothetical protein